MKYIKGTYIQSFCQYSQEIIYSSCFMLTSYCSNSNSLLLYHFHHLPFLSVLWWASILGASEIVIAWLLHTFAWDVSVNKYFIQIILNFTYGIFYLLFNIINLLLCNHWSYNLNSLYSILKIYLIFILLVDSTWVTHCSSFVFIVVFIEEFFEVLVKFYEGWGFIIDDSFGAAIFIINIIFITLLHLVLELLQINILIRWYYRVLLNLLFKINLRLRSLQHLLVLLFLLFLNCA